MSSCNQKCKIESEDRQIYCINLCTNQCMAGFRRVVSTTMPNLFDLISLLNCSVANLKSIKMMTKTNNPSRRIPLARKVPVKRARLVVTAARTPSHQTAKTSQPISLSSQKRPVAALNPTLALMLSRRRNPRVKAKNQQLMTAKRRASNTATQKKRRPPRNKTPRKPKSPRKKSQ